MITLDTSAIVALLDRKDQDHDAVTKALRRESPPYLVPAAVLGEVGYFIETRFGQTVLERFLDDLSAGAFVLDCGEGDVRRVRDLVARFADLHLGLVDAAVIACAERRGGRVLTLDQRDFGVVARDVPLSLVPGFRCLRMLDLAVRQARACLFTHESTLSYLYSIRTTHASFVRRDGLRVGGRWDR